MKNMHKQSSAIFSIVIVLLILCNMLSLAVLFSRLSTYSHTVFQNVIPLTESRGITKVIQTTRQELPSQSFLPTDSFAQPQTIQLANVNSGAGVVQLANPDFKAYDESTVWLSETNVEIFKLTYDGDNGITVMGTDGDKLIAPGTSNEYVFTLENTGDVLLDYEMTMEAKITGTDLELPVKARVWDYTDKYLLGNVSEKADVLELNSVSETSKLSAGRFAVYTLEWEWPYELGNDEYDTMIGNLAVDDDIALTITIKTVASYDVSENDESENDNPQIDYGLENDTTVLKTGETMIVIPFVIVITFSLMIVLITRPKRRKDEADIR